MKDLRIVTCEAFDQLGLVAHGMSMGGDPKWNMSFRFGESQAVIKARSIFGKLTGIPVERIAKANQVHGREVLCVGEKDAGKNGLDGCSVGDGDALITNVPNVPLAILVADCVPIFLVDPVTPAIGLVHAGWRGTDKRIAAAAVAAMKREYGVNPRNLLAWIGPSIGKSNFKVSMDLFEQFRVQFGESAEAFDSQNISIDLKTINQMQLVKANLRPENIHISPHCTVESRDFFSFRRDGKGCGHMMGVLMLRPDAVSGSSTKSVQNSVPQKPSAQRKSRKERAA